jgi:hypothetical protein
MMSFIAPGTGEAIRDIGKMPISLSFLLTGRPQADGFAHNPFVVNRMWVFLHIPAKGFNSKS